MIGKITVALILVLLLGYGAIEARPLVLGPSITVHTPGDHEALPDGIGTISGKVLRSTAFTVNGNPVITNEQGAFSFPLSFPKGSSILTFVAKDRFGRTATTTRTIYVP